MKTFFLLLLLAAVFSSCINAKKVTEWNNDHPQQAATYCAGVFPCIVKPADTTFAAADTSALVALINDLSASYNAVNEINDSLLLALRHDTACIKYEASIQRLRQENNLLHLRLKNLKRAPDTIKIKYNVLDTAALVSVVLDRDYKAEKLSEANNKLAQKTGMSKVRLWMLIASIILNLLLLVLLFKKESR